jgi:hypothetical protein
MPRQRKTLQVSTEAFKKLQNINQSTGISYIDLIVSLSGVAKPIELPWIPQELELSTTKKYNPVDKPYPVIIDCAILSCWDADYMDMIERDVLAPETEDFINRNRYDIKTQVTYKMKNGWSEIYQKWFKENHKHNSYFERTLASRLSALVKANLVIADSTGVYRVSPVLAGTGMKK